MSEQLAEPSERATRFLRNLFAEYENRSEAQKKSERDERGVFFDIGYVNGCYYDFEQVRSCTDELIEEGYLSSFGRPGYGTAHAVFTPEGAERCKRLFSKKRC